MLNEKVNNFIKHLHFAHPDENSKGCAFYHSQCLLSVIRDALSQNQSFVYLF